MFGWSDSAGDEYQPWPPSHVWGAGPCCRLGHRSCLPCRFSLSRGLSSFNSLAGAFLCSSWLPRGENGRCNIFQVQVQNLRRSTAAKARHRDTGLRGRGNRLHSSVAGQAKSWEIGRWMWPFLVTTYLFSTLSTCLEHWSCSMVIRSGI